MLPCWVLGATLGGALCVDFSSDAKLEAAVCGRAVTTTMSVL